MSVQVLTIIIIRAVKKFSYKKLMTLAFAGCIAMPLLPLLLPAFFSYTLNSH